MMNNNLKRMAKEKLTRSQNERTTLTVHWKISQLHWTACAYCKPSIILKDEEERKKLRCPKYEGKRFF